MKRPLAVVLSYSIVVSLHAQCELGWSSMGGMVGTNGQISCLRTWDPDGPASLPPLLVAGGDFSVAGTAVASRIAAWDGQFWHPFGTGLDGPPRVLASFNNDLVAGGDFGQAGGGAAAHIATWDGAHWSSFGSGLDDSVRAIAVFRSTLFAGGLFNSAGGAPAPFLARWDGAAWRAVPGELDGPVYALLATPETLYVGGEFAHAGESFVNGIAGWDGSAWSPVGAGVSAGRLPGLVYSLSLHDGALIAGGGFLTAGGARAERVARWDGTRWSALGSGAAPLPFPITSMESSGNVLYVADGQDGAAAWDGTGWRSLVSGIYPPGAVGAFAEFGGQLVGGGTGVEGESDFRSVIAEWDGAQWSPIGQGLHSVWPIGIYHGELLAYAHFINGLSPPMFSALWTWNGERWSRLSPGGVIQAASLIDGELFGAFGSNPGLSLGQWSDGRWNLVAPGLAPGGSVHAIFRYRGELIAGGTFGTFPPLPWRYLARWDGNNWQRTGCNGNVNVLGEWNNDLVVGGSFSMIGGEEVNGLARWDGTNWSSFGSGVRILTESVWTVAAAGRDLFVGGNFRRMSGVSAFGLARFDGTEWHSVGAGPGSEAGRIAVVDGQVYATGTFHLPDGGEPALLVVWQGGESLRRLGSLTDNAYVTSNGAIQPGAGGIVQYHDGLIVGGSFAVADGRVSAHWARWGCPPCYANCDGSTEEPRLSAADFMCFLNRFASSDPYANCDGSTVPPVLNVRDFACFMSRFVGGCP